MRENVDPIKLQTKHYLCNESLYVIIVSPKGEYEEQIKHHKVFFAVYYDIFRYYNLDLFRFYDITFLMLTHYNISLIVNLLLLNHYM